MWMVLFCTFLLYVDGNEHCKRNFATKQQEFPILFSQRIPSALFQLQSKPEKLCAIKFEIAQCPIWNYTAVSIAIEESKYQKTLFSEFQPFLKTKFIKFSYSLLHIVSLDIEQIQNVEILAYPVVSERRLDTIDEWDNDTLRCSVIISLLASAVTEFTPTISLQISSYDKTPDLGTFCRLKCYILSDDVEVGSVSNRILWKKNNAIIRADSNYKIYFNTETITSGVVVSILDILAIKYEDYGEYKCLYYLVNDQRLTGMITLNSTDDDPGRYYSSTYYKPLQKFIGSLEAPLDNEQEILKQARLYSANIGANLLKERTIKYLLNSSFYRTNETTFLLNEILLRNSIYLHYVYSLEDDEYACLNISDLHVHITEEGINIPKHKCEEVHAILYEIDYGVLYSMEEYPSQCQYKDVSNQYSINLKFGITGSATKLVRCYIVQNDDNDVSEENDASEELIAKINHGSIVNYKISPVPFGKKIMCSEFTNGSDLLPKKLFRKVIDIPEKVKYSNIPWLGYENIFFGVNNTLKSKVVSNIGNFYEKASISCHASGYPFPKFKWFASYINESGNYSIDEELSDKSDPYIDIIESYDHNFAEAPCSSVHRQSVLTFKQINIRHAHAFFCETMDETTNETYSTNKVNIKGIAMKITSDVEYYMHDGRYLGRFSASGWPLPDINLNCNHALSWTVEDVKHIENSTFTNFIIYSITKPTLSGHCNISIYNGIGNSLSIKGEYTPYEEKLELELNRASKILKCVVYAFPIVLEKIEMSCSHSLVKDGAEQNLNDYIGFFHVVATAFRVIEEIPDFFSSCVCNYKSLSVSITVYPISYDRKYVYLQDRELEDAVNIFPQKYEPTSLTRLEVYMNKLLVLAKQKNLDGNAIVEVGRTLRYVSDANLTTVKLLNDDDLNKGIKLIFQTGCKLINEVFKDSNVDKSNFSQRMQILEFLDDFSTKLALNFRGVRAISCDNPPVMISLEKFILPNDTGFIIQSEQRVDTPNNFGIKNIIQANASSFSSKYRNKEIAGVYIFTTSEISNKIMNIVSKPLTTQLDNERFQTTQTVHAVYSGLAMTSFRHEHESITVPIKVLLNNIDTISKVNSDTYSLKITVQCSIWSKTEKTWDETSCEKDIRYSSASQTLCKCKQTSIAAVNVLAYETKTDVWMFNANYLLISVLGSNIGLIINIVNFFLQVYVDRTMKNEQNKIHSCLCLTIILLQIVYLAGLQRKEQILLCKFSAAAMYNLMLMTLCWNLSVAIYVCNRLYKFVHNPNFRFMCFASFSVGYSLSITTACFVLWKDRFGKGTGCWIDMDGKILWFLSTYAPLVMLNIAALIFTAYKLTKMKVSNKLKRQILYTVKGEVILIPSIQMTFTFLNFGMTRKEIIFQVGNGFSFMLLALSLFLYTIILNPEFHEARVRIKKANKFRSEFKKILIGLETVRAKTPFMN